MMTKFEKDIHTNLNDTYYYMDCFKVLGNIKNGGLRPSIQDESREIVILLQFCHVCPIFPLRS